jgi:hypothetical protein
MRSSYSPWPRVGLALSLSLVLCLQGCGSKVQTIPVLNMPKPCYKVSAYTTSDHQSHPFAGRACLYDKDGQDFIMLESAQERDASGQLKRWNLPASQVESITPEKAKVVGNPWWKDRRVLIGGLLILGGVLIIGFGTAFFFHDRGSPVTN